MIKRAYTNADFNGVANLTNEAPFPRRVKLSDAAMAALLSMGIKYSTLKTGWPLDFNAAGGPLAQPPRMNIGRPALFNNKWAAIPNLGGVYMLHGDFTVERQDDFAFIPRKNQRAAVPPFQKAKTIDLDTALATTEPSPQGVSQMAFPNFATLNPQSTSTTNFPPAFQSKRHTQKTSTAMPDSETNTRSSPVISSSPDLLVAPTSKRVTAMRITSSSPKRAKINHDKGEDSEELEGMNLRQLSPTPDTDKDDSQFSSVQLAKDFCHTIVGANRIDACAYLSTDCVHTAIKKLMELMRDVKKMDMAEEERKYLINQLEDLREVLKHDLFTMIKFRDEGRRGLGMFAQIICEHEDELVLPKQRMRDFEAALLADEDKAMDYLVKQKKMCLEYRTKRAEGGRKRRGSL